MKQWVLTAVVLLGAADSIFAASFIVPTDEELVAKSTAIIVGTVEGSFVQETDGTVETVFEIRPERRLKGEASEGGLVRVVSWGGRVGEGGVIVPGEAWYEQGERVLVFLTLDARGQWRTTDLTLGRFRFVTSTTGDRLLVRAMEDVVGWDHAGRTHREKVRREEGFLRFIEERVKGRPAATSYVVEASDVTLATTGPRLAANATSYPAATFTSFVNNQPIRWPNISAGVPFYKRSDQNIPGAADGGIGTIQSGLAAWTNECGSVINLSYAGQIAKASQNFDSTNVVEFNDPQQRISGSFGGSGTVGITFISFSGETTFLGRAWLNISDADVVFQDGYSATNVSFPAAMTHELGHGIGWRHSNQNHATGGACNSAVEECTSAAIMNSSVSGAYGFTLQPWDINAAQSVYPGGSCGPACTPPSIVTQPQSSTVAAGTNVTLTVSASGTAPLSYQWYVGASGNTSAPISGATGPSVTVSVGAATSYWVRVTNACGFANSAAATIATTITQPASGSAARLFLVTPCRVIDTRSAVGASGGPELPPGTVRAVVVTGRCGVPTTAKAIVSNVTVLPSSGGYLTVYPGTGSGPPLSSTMNFRAGRNLANNAIVRLSSDGKVSVYNGAATAVHFIIDVNGYMQ